MKVCLLTLVLVKNNYDVYDTILKNTMLFNYCKLYESKFINIKLLQRKFNISTLDYQYDLMDRVKYSKISSGIVTLKNLYFKKTINLEFFLKNINFSIFGLIPIFNNYYYDSSLLYVINIFFSKYDFYETVKNNYSISLDREYSFIYELIMLLLPNAHNIKNVSFILLDNDFLKYHKYIIFLFTGFIKSNSYFNIILETRKNNNSLNILFYKNHIYTFSKDGGTYFINLIR